MIAANYAADWCKAKIVCVFRLSGQPAPAWAKWSAAKQRFAALCVAFDPEMDVGPRESPNPSIAQHVTWVALNGV